MNESHPKPKTRFQIFSWRRTRYLVMTLAVLATLVAAFYAVENWRGKRAWEQCRRDMTAQGIAWEWSAHIPPPVPDDQNFFKAPYMSAWFARHTAPMEDPHAYNWDGLRVRKESKLTDTAMIRLIDTAITNPAVAADFLKWSDPLRPNFDLMREAFKRPYFRIEDDLEGDYSLPEKTPFVNFVQVRNVSRLLTRRAQCHLLLGQPENALAEVTLVNGVRRMLENKKPLSLVCAMISVAVAGLNTTVIGDGLKAHQWQEPQLVELQKQLADINLLPLLPPAHEADLAMGCNIGKRLAEARWPSSIWLAIFEPNSRRKDRLEFIKWDVMPRGWIYQNLTFYARLYQKLMFDASQSISPRKIQATIDELDQKTKRPSLFNALARIAFPNVVKATRTCAQNQASVAQAQIVCALERYRLQQGEYPPTLDALVPQFIAQLPRDPIGGGPMIYRRDGAHFILYSIGWNERDDGGEVSAPDQGDWVWGA